MYKSMSSFNGDSVGGDSGFLTKIRSYFNTKVLIVIGVLVVLMGISLFYYYRYVAPKLTTSFSENKQPQSASGTGGGQAEFLLFYVDWCPHCKTAKPEWEKVKQEYQGKSINGTSITFKEINCTNESPEIEKMVSQYNIEGYPTLKLLKGDQVIDFDSKPTQASLKQFLNSVL